MQHYDFELFNRLLKKVRTKKKGFRMNWIDIYYYAGLGGNIKSFEFLKDINSYRTSHGESCMRGALHGANLELTKYLKEKNKIRIPLYYNSVNKLINDNAVEFIKYLYNLNHEELIRYVDPYQAIRPLIKHRSAELIKLLIHINRDYIKNHILRIVGCDKETIEWLISNEIMDLNNGSEYMRLLQSSSFTTTLIYYIENGFVDKKDVDWDDILSRVLSYRYGRERKLKILLEFIIDDLDNRTINNLIALSSQYQFMTKLIIILNNLGTTVNSKSLLDYIFANGIRMHYDDIRDIYTTIDFSNLT